MEQSVAKAISERVRFVDNSNLAIIDGVAVSGEFLSAFTQSTPAGMWFRVERIDGNAVIHYKTDER